MTLILDAGAFIAIERGDRVVLARVALAQREREAIVTSAAAVAQVVRNSARQVRLQRSLAIVDERPLDRHVARQIGALLATSGGSDVVDAAIAVLAVQGDELLTSDPGDLRALVGEQDITITTV